MVIVKESDVVRVIGALAPETEQRTLLFQAHSEQKHYAYRNN